MHNLFVDIDDTLILWDGNTYDYKVNDNLVQGIIDFRQKNRGSKIIIWSGGGKDYAQLWTRKLDLDRYDIINLMKIEQVVLQWVKEGDIIIDDEMEKYRTHGPFDWPDEDDEYEEFDWPDEDEEFDWPDEEEEIINE